MLTEIELLEKCICNCIDHACEMTLFTIFLYKVGKAVVKLFIGFR